MLVDTRWDPPPVPDDPPPERPPRQRTWQLRDFGAAYWLVGGLALAVGSSLFTPLVAYVVLLVSFGCVGRGLGGLVRHPSGLRDHRQ
jgi:hypothetical protein